MFDYKRHLIRLPAKCVVLFISLAVPYALIFFILSLFGITPDKDFGYIIFLTVLCSSFYFDGFWKWLDK